MIVLKPRILFYMKRSISPVTPFIDPRLRLFSDKVCIDNRIHPLDACHSFDSHGKGSGLS